MLLTVFVLSGCTGSQTTSDCAVAIRYDGTTYYEGGFTERSVDPLGRGEMSSCDDTGSDPKGAYFGDDAEKVDVWSFRGYDADQVVGIREEGRVVRVLLAEDLPERARRALRESGLLDE